MPDDHSPPEPADAPPAPSVVPSATCLGCGCLCDDVGVAVRDDRIVGAARACPTGLGWFAADHPAEGRPLATVDGRRARPGLAVDRIAEGLLAARSPMAWGLVGSPVEAVGEAVALMDRLRGAVDLAGSADRAGFHHAVARLGRVSSTLGEVKARSEVVVFWGLDPRSTHPRHLERYSGHPAGRFLPRGRLDRTLVLVADRADPDPGADFDLHLHLSPRPDALASSLATFRAIARGVEVDPDRVLRSTGVPLAGWRELADRLAAARHSAIFFGPGVRGPSAWSAALEVVGDLNVDGRRCVGLSMGEPGNPAGAASTLTWQAGAPWAVDFALGHPRHLPLEATLEARLDSGEVDALLVVGDHPSRWLAPSALARLDRIPWSWVGPEATRPATEAARGPVASVATARLGIEAGGTVERVDGVMLPLRPILAARYPTDRAILRAILDRVEALAPETRPTPGRRPRPS